LCYYQRTAVPAQELSEIRDDIRFNEGVPENFENKKGKPCLIILDDLLNDVYSEEVCSLYERQSSPKYQCNFDYPKSFTRDGTVGIFH